MFWEGIYLATAIAATITAVLFWRDRRFWRTQYNREYRERVKLEMAMFKFIKSGGLKNEDTPILRGLQGEHRPRG